MNRRSFITALFGFSAGFHAGAKCPTINVRQFGAIGDGLTNDSLAIQRAIDSWAEQAANCYIHFPSGKYNLG